MFATRDGCLALQQALNLVSQICLLRAAPPIPQFHTAAAVAEHGSFVCKVSWDYNVIDFIAIRINRR